MHVCLDVGYTENGATAACVGFDDWLDAEPVETLATCIDEVSDYVSGEFYQRELPCLLAILSQLTELPTTIVVDGHVYLDESDRPGLGWHLFDALGERVPVIGVAKSSFRSFNGATEVFRGDSLRPLFVTAVGVAEDEAVSKIQQMHGPHRIPTLLRLVDQLSRGSRPT